jgi:LL-diaminopimelate aminotransferase
LKEQNGFLPDLEAVPADVALKAKIMYLNYPNNPTAATADEGFFEQVVAFARRHEILVCHDAAYTEISFEGYKAPSFLKVKGARDFGIEFHSLSKTYNMTGWRIGFCVGNRDAVAGLGKVKTNIDSGVFQAVQYAGVEALLRNDRVPEQLSKIYQKRRDRVVEGLRASGLSPFVPRAAFYVWCPVPGGMGSKEFAKRLLVEAGVVVTPGVGFGDHGEGYFRITLTQSEEKLEEALVRIQGVAKQLW